MSAANLIAAFEEITASRLSLQSELASVQTKLDALPAPGTAQFARDSKVRQQRALLQAQMTELRDAVSAIDEEERSLAAQLGIVGSELELSTARRQRKNVELAKRQVLSQIGGYFGSADQDFVAEYSLGVREERARLNSLPSCTIALGDEVNGRPTLHPDVPVSSVLQNFKRLVAAAEDVQGCAAILEKGVA